VVIFFVLLLTKNNIIVIMRTPETDLVLRISCLVNYREATEEQKQRALAVVKRFESSTVEWDQPWTVHISQKYGGHDRLISFFLLGNSFDYDWDGKAFVISSWVGDKEVRTQPLLPQHEVTIDVPLEVVEGDAQRKYVMRLHVAWPKFERPNARSLAEVLSEIENESAWRTFDQKNDEVWVSISYGYHDQEHYNKYPAAQFPQAFLADVTKDAKTFEGVGFIELSHWYYTMETCCHSDDYIDAARAHGEDATGEWLSRESHMDEKKWLYEVLF